MRLYAKKVLGGRFVDPNLRKNQSKIKKRGDVYANWGKFIKEIKSRFGMNSTTVLASFCLLDIP